MKQFITSDLHFFHSNIIKYCPVTRGNFTSAHAMNEFIVSEWNTRVSADDVVFILGDVSFGKLNDTVAILNCLNGTKILIEGNHDKKLLKEPKFRECFDQIYNYYEHVVDGVDVCMFHYPIHYEWNKSHRGSVMLHGHTHGNKTGLEEYRVRDVGFDATGNVVSLLRDVVDDALTGKISLFHTGGK